jgi:hypothetical protein
VRDHLVDQIVGDLLDPGRIRSTAPVVNAQAISLRSDARP